MKKNVPFLKHTPHSHTVKILTQNISLKNKKKKKTPWLKFQYKGLSN